ncbi:hypothetical protein FNV43_RR01996 [Rhamnella rubrinervis]|uniref:Uncharacterized protein n=1 Tax=Rhamnella rubrinervis TaxID=2594499 RepID=A0A8K0MTE1_9ROSA|nr:hypothetical protein FNV43_RR01996 [Rhamnella rubrinervis]
MTRHDRNLLRGMTLDEVGLEAEQNALKLAQNARYLYDAVIKVDKAFKKKSEAYINAVAANKTLEENNLALKQTAMEATKRAEQLERKWSEADQKLIEKDKELEALRLDYAQVDGERDALQARVAQWPGAKKHIYKKAAIDTILKNTNDMIRAFKAGQTEDWVTPDPSDEEEDGQEDMEITSGEDEPDEGDASSETSLLHDAEPIVYLQRFLRGGYEIAFKRRIRFGPNLPHCGRRRRDSK